MTGVTSKDQEENEEVVFEQANEVVNNHYKESVNVEVSDMEKFTFLYKNQHAIQIELWDTVGMEKFNKDYIYSQSYLKGKHGVVYIVDGTRFFKNIDPKQTIDDVSELGVNEVLEETIQKIDMIDESIQCPILIIFNRIRDTPEEI